MYRRDKCERMRMREKEKETTAGQRAREMQRQSKELQDEWRAGNHQNVQ